MKKILSKVKAEEKSRRARKNLEKQQDEEQDDEQQVASVEQHQPPQEEEDIEIVDKTTTTATEQESEQHEKEAVSTPKSKSKKEDQSGDQSISDLCAVCHGTLDKNKVCYISSKNVEEYTKCFVFYDGTLGRACQRCYNKFYVWKSQMKHKEKKCACCLKAIQKQSCSFQAHADIYKTLFPGAEGDKDSRVCQSCYYKGLKLRNESNEDNDKSEKKPRKRNRRKKDDDVNTSTSSIDETMSPLKRLRMDEAQAHVIFDFIRYVEVTGSAESKPIILSSVARAVDPQMTVHGLYNYVTSLIQEELRITPTGYSMVLLTRDAITGSEVAVPIQVEMTHPVVNNSRIIVTIST